MTGVPRWQLILALSWLCGCGDELELEACDIREPSCQNAIFYAVQRIRSTSWDPWLDVPPMRVITKDAYRAELERARAQRSQDPESYDYFTPSMKLLDMIDPHESTEGATDFTVSFVAAYYDTETRAITIIDRGSDNNPMEDAATLAHELVHAAQERDVGFETISSWATNIDSRNATAALIEGEASLYENLFVAALRGVPALKIRWEQYHHDWLQKLRAKIAQDPSPWRIASSGLRYPLGSQYMTDAWLSGGALEVRTALAQHPTATARLLLGRGSELDVPNKRWGCTAAAAPQDNELVLNTVLGAWGVYAFATRLSMVEPEAWRFAEDWVADRIWAYSTDNKSLRVVWKVRLSDATRAEAFAAALVRLPDDVFLLHEVEDDTITLLASSDPELLEWADWTECAQNK